MSLLRWLSGLVLSLVFVVVGMVLAFFGLIVVIASVIDVVEHGELSRVLVAIIGLAAVFGSVRLITRLRPWAIRRLCGHEVPRVPALFAAMWNSPSGAYAGDGGGSCGGDGGGGAGC